MTSPTPNVPIITQSTSFTGVKIATKDIILYADETVPVEVMTDLIFEDIGGQEIINIARNDIINGQSVIYQPIKNVTSLYFQYNPQNILALQDTSEEFFKKFSIKLENTVPNIGNGPNGETVYIDPETGNLIINVINLNSDEQVEIEILKQGSVFNDTIYGEEQ
jgi:hypothetical protein